MSKTSTLAIEGQSRSSNQMLNGPILPRTSCISGLFSAKRYVYVCLQSSQPLLISECFCFCLWWRFTPKSFSTGAEDRATEAMSRFQRVHQWATFSRKWWVYDCKWQNPFHSAKIITPVLEGKHKPVYHPYNECGDHVVVVNSRHVALLGQEWQIRVYYHHTGYPGAHRASSGGKHWIPAWQLHARDPTLVLWKACYNNIFGGILRYSHMARLHVYPDEEVPDAIMKNVSDQLPQARPVPKPLQEYSQQEVRDFPKLWDLPEEYVVK